MKKIMLKQVVSSFVLCAVLSSLSAIPVSNFDFPYDVDFRLKNFDKNSWIFGARAELGQSKMGYNQDSNRSQILSTYAASQSAIASFKGASTGSAIANFLTTTLNGAADDGVRGNFKPDAKFSQADMTLWGKYKLPFQDLPGVFYMSAYLPIRSVSISEVTWVDQTLYATADDLTVHQQLSDQLGARMQEFGNLNINSWDRTALGDTVIMIGWYKDFKQTKEALKNVTIQARLGVSCPTSCKRDEDRALSMSTGNDGSWAIPVGLGLDLDFLYAISAGIDVTYLALFNETRNFRLKTDATQSDYLLLTKGRAVRVSAPTWNFNLYLKAASIVKGLSLLAQYEFCKHDEDKLYPEGDAFSYSIVNSAQSLQEWSFHNLVFRSGFDFCHVMRDKSFAPRFDVYAKIPVMGKRVFAPVTYGLELSVAF